jgi:tetratricopeptide (TPR) repeat protein
MNTSPQTTPQTAREWFNLGKQALERGFPQDAIQALETALDQSYPQSYLGGEIQIWLATAYEATGQHQAAMDRCRQLRQHPDPRIRKQSADILYIWEAPVLQTRPDWLVKIPDLSQMEDNPQPTAGAGLNRPKKQTRPIAPEPELDPAVINRRDNGFVWIGILVLCGVMSLWAIR